MNVVHMVPQIQQWQQSEALSGTPAGPAPAAASVAAGGTATPPAAAAATFPAATPPAAAAATPPAATPPSNTPPGVTTALSEPVKPADPTPAAAPIKPEDYQVNLPQGLEKGPVLDSLTAAAAEKGVSQETLQHIIDKAGPALAKQFGAGAEQWAALHETWMSELKADATIGGDKFSAATSLVKSTLTKYAGADLEALQAGLNLTGAGNNPALVRTLHRMAVALNEGGPVGGGSPSTQQSATSLMYPTHNT